MQVEDGSLVVSKDGSAGIEVFKVEIPVIGAAPSPVEVEVSGPLVSVAYESVSDRPVVVAVIKERSAGIEFGLDHRSPCGGGVVCPDLPYKTGVVVKIVTEGRIDGNHFRCRCRGSVIHVLCHSAMVDQL